MTACKACIHLYFESIFCKSPRPNVSLKQKSDSVTIYVEAIDNMNARDKTARKNHHIETGKRIRIERILQGLTQEEAAEKLGISERQYRRYENGESGINLIILEKFDDIGFDIYYIFSGVVEADYYVTKGFEVMPKEEYSRITGRFYKIVRLGLPTGDSNEDSLRELSSIFDYCQNYGRKHSMDKKLREIEECHILTTFHERKAEETELKNHHLHVN